MEEKKNLLTYAGLQKLEEELHDLKVVKRKEVAGKIKEAREQGDLSENAEYDAAKENQGKLESRIAMLKDQVANARIIDSSKISCDKVQIMNKVRLLNKRMNKEMIYTIVAESEANFREGKISVQTPIAKALLNHVVGDVVEVRVPAGVQQLEILEISI